MLLKYTLLYFVFCSLMYFTLNTYNNYQVWKTPSNFAGFDAIFKLRVEIDCWEKQRKEKKNIQFSLVFLYEHHLPLNTSALPGFQLILLPKISALLSTVLLVFNQTVIMFCFVFFFKWQLWNFSHYYYIFILIFATKRPSFLL